MSIQYDNQTDSLYIDFADRAEELPNASSLCGACWDACPVGIPLQDLLLGLRREAAKDASTTQKLAWGAWASAWSRSELRGDSRAPPRPES